MGSEEVVRSEFDGLTEWVRETDDPDIRGVSASFEPGAQWSWQVGITAAEGVRDEPFESEFRDRIASAIRSVSGITDVVEEDREVWLAVGDADGEALVLTVGAALDAMAEKIRAAWDEE